MSVGRVDPASAVVGTVVGAAGLLVLLEPVVGPLAVGNLRVRPFALGMVVLTVGFGLGAVVYLRRGRRLVGVAHAIGAVGWGAVVAATGLGSEALLLAGVAVLVGGSLFLLDDLRRAR